MMPPLAGTMQRFHASLRIASKAIHWPSALQLGLPTDPPAKVVNGFDPDPSRFATHSSTWPDLEELNAIRVPSGENCGSPSRDVDAMTRNGASPDGSTLGDGGVGSSQMFESINEF